MREREWFCRCMWPVAQFLLHWWAVWLALTCILPTPPAEARFVFPRRPSGLGSNQFPVQWVPGVKQPGREAYYPPLSSTEVKNECTGTSIPPYAFVACTGRLYLPLSLPVTVHSVFDVRGRVYFDLRWHLYTVVELEVVALLKKVKLSLVMLWRRMGE